MYTISQVAKKMNIAPSTLRFYDKEGLLPFVGRTEGNIRVFKDEDLEWLNLIECLKASSMPIKDIKQFIDWFYEGDSTLELRREMFRQRKQIVEEEMAAMQNTLDMLTYKCWFYDTACKLGSDTLAKQISPSDMPAHIRALKEDIDARHASATGDATLAG